MNARARPAVGLGVVVMDAEKNKVLMGIRRGAHEEGFFAFPGGHLEWYEQLDYCARRELKEEVGWRDGMNYTLIDKFPVVATNDLLPADGKHYITLFLRALYIKGRARNMEPKKCDGWRWYEWKKLPEMNISVPIVHLFEQGYNPFKK